MHYAPVIILVVATIVGWRRVPEARLSSRLSSVAVWTLLLGLLAAVGYVILGHKGLADSSGIFPYPY